MSDNIRFLPLSPNYKPDQALHAGLNEVNGKHP